MSTNNPPPGAPRSRRKLRPSLGVALALLGILVVPALVNNVDVGVHWRDVITGANIHNPTRYSATAALAVALLTGLVVLKSATPD